MYTQRNLRMTPEQMRKHIEDQTATVTTIFDVIIGNHPNLRPYLTQAHAIILGMASYYKQDYKDYHTAHSVLVSLAENLIDDEAFGYVSSDIAEVREEEARQAGFDEGYTERMSGH